MCTVAAIPAALSAAGSVVSFAGKQQAVDDYNANAAVAHRDASLAAQYKYEQEAQRNRYDAKDILIKGFEAVLKGREARATAIASAGASGFDTSSITISSLIDQEANKSARNEAVIKDQLDDLAESYVSRTKGYQMEAQGRINTTPFKSGPNPLELAIDLAGSAFKGYSAYKGEKGGS